MSRIINKDKKTTYEQTEETNEHLKTIAEELTRIREILEENQQSDYDDDDEMEPENDDDDNDDQDEKPRENEEGE